MPENLENDADNSEVSDNSDVFSFHYIKSNQFRVIHVDGMVGGPSPSMDGIQMALFSERIPIPLRVEVKTLDDGNLEEVFREGREGVTREIDVNAMMSIETAEALGNWLLEQVESVRQFLDEK